MMCYCGSTETRVVDTRAHKGAVVRKRLCKGCQRRFTTSERIAAEFMSVQKRDGDTQPFSRAKLRKGIMKAAAAHPLGPEEVEVYVERVMQMLQTESPDVPIASHEIGELILQQLHNDASTEVLHIRYAMVLLGRTARRGFRRLRDFLNWLEDEYGEPRVAQPDRTPWTVIKQNGKREPFDVQKLARAVGISSKGRGDDDEVRRLADRVAVAVQEALKGQGLVTTGQIAAAALKFLRDEDPLAYLRYASAVKVYQSVDDFWMDAFGFTEP